MCPLWTSLARFPSGELKFLDCGEPRRQDMGLEIPGTHDASHGRELAEWLWCTAPSSETRDARRGICS